MSRRQKKAKRVKTAWAWLFLTQPFIFILLICTVHSASLQRCPICFHNPTEQRRATIAVTLNHVE